jgi:hypothetical protein
MNSTKIVGTSPPPPGVTPNFVNPQSNGYQIIIAGIVLPVVMLPFLGARLYAKYNLLKKIHYDDCKSSSHFYLLEPWLIETHRHDYLSSGKSIFIENQTRMWLI